VVLTHGFTLDENGRKMSKSLGNTTDPAKVIKDSGADILRLWVCATDYSDDQRIGPEILKNTIETYRKLRNTIRWMLGTLHHFKRSEAVSFSEMPELEQLMLHRLSEVDSIIRPAYANFDYKTVIATLANFMNTELSAFYFDIRKDTLYCDPPSSLARKAALTTVDILCDAILKWLAPAISFTADEAWRMYRPDAEPSVHLTTFRDDLERFRNDALAKKWETIRDVRRVVTGALEVERAAKRIGSSLEASPLVYVSDKAIFATLFDVDLAEVCITSNAMVTNEDAPAGAFTLNEVPGVAVVVEKAVGTKCARSWKILPTVGEDSDYPDVSPRDAQALREWKALESACEPSVPHRIDRRRCSPCARSGVETLAAECVRTWPARHRPDHAVFRSGARLEYRDQLRLVPGYRPGRANCPAGLQGAGDHRAGRLDGPVRHPAGGDRPRADYRRRHRQYHRPAGLWRGGRFRPVSCRDRRKNL
jgi:isoleucyl-tRNA synthetase